MWELYAKQDPYHGMSNESIVEQVKKGEMLPKPDTCPEEVYSILKSCWAQDPNVRTSFGNISDFFYSKSYRS